MLQKDTSFAGKTRDRFESGGVGNVILGLAKIRKAKHSLGQIP